MRIEQAFDIARIGNLGCEVADDGGTFQFAMTSGEYCHSDLSGALDIDGVAVTRLASVTDFAAAITTAMNTQSSSAGTYLVQWVPTLLVYTVENDTANFVLTFSSATVAADGTRLRELLGFSGTQSGDLDYTSDQRPSHLIVPTIQARSDVEDEYEEAGLVTEASADDGTAYQTGVDGSTMKLDWTQHAETNAVPATIAGEGTPVFKRTSASSLTPWSYQHAWAHLKDGQPPFLVVDPAETSGAVFEMRAEGCSFKPRRFKGKDYDLFSLDFKARLLGRLP